MAARTFGVLLIGFAIVGGQSIGTRIIGGRDVQEIYPYQASVRVKGAHICGASLLNHRWLLTAGHCLTTYTKTSIAIILGTTDIQAGGVAYKVDQLVIHPNYGEKPRDNDIGLIKVAGYINYTKDISPVKLPQKDINETDVYAVFTGWGIIKMPERSHYKLQEIELKVLELSKCKEYVPAVTDSYLCTLTIPGEGLCYGDSGSPLVADGEQIGVGCRVIPCARGKPDRHTRVFYYVDWIKSHVNQDE